MENANSLPVKLNIENIAKRLETLSNQKPVIDNIFRTDYMFGNIEVDMLESIGFEYIGMSNTSGFLTPMYRYGNIEAIFVDQILHMYEVTA